MSKVACPQCGVLTLRPGAVKCPACREWVGAAEVRPKSGLARALRATALGCAGLLLGGAAAALGLSGAVGARLFPEKPAPAPSAVASAAPSASASASGAPGSPGAPPPARAGGGPVTFAEPRLVRVATAPVDAVIGDDDATFFVLGDDGAVRAYELATGKELRKVMVPGKGSQLRLLAGKHLAVVGAIGTLPVIDLATYAVTRVDLGSTAVDVVALESAPSIVAASGAARKLARFSLDGFRLEGQILLPRPIAGLGLAHAGASGKETLAVLSPDRGAFAVGAIDLIDPSSLPFGSSRNSWMAAVDPRWGAASEASLFVVDAAQSLLLELSAAQPPRAARVDRHPLSAHRLAGGWVATVNGAGTVSVLAESTLALEATLALGAEPADAAATADGRALLVALGGGPGERGAVTAVVTGDPPTVTERLPTGPGSHAVRFSKSGRFAAVAAHFGRSVAILERR